MRVSIILQGLSKRIGAPTNKTYNKEEEHCGPKLTGQISQKKKELEEERVELGKEEEKGKCGGFFLAGGSINHF